MHRVHGPDDGNLGGHALQTLVLEVVEQLVADGARRKLKFFLLVAQPHDYLEVGMVLGRNIALDGQPGVFAGLSGEIAEARHLRRRRYPEARHLFVAHHEVLVRAHAQHRRIGKLLPVAHGAVGGGRIGGQWCSGRRCAVRPGSGLCWPRPLTRPPIGRIK